MINTKEKISERLMTESMRLLQKIGPGYMMTTAYDTAWVAQLIDQLPEVAYEAIEWLRKNQLDDGSWGARELVYHHDRVICTLAAVIALRKYGDEQADRDRVADGLFAFHEHFNLLQHDLAGETVAFEMLIPTLFEEAIKLGLLPPLEPELLEPMQKVREVKLAGAPKGLISRAVTMAFSAEMAGADGQDMLDTDNLVERNGSVGLSPSATAYYMLNINPDDMRAKNYLKNILQDGGAPNVAPFDVFERGWTVWNLSLAGLANKPQFRGLLEPHILFLHDSWTKGRATAFGSMYTPNDGDTSGLVFEVLNEFDHPVPIEDVLQFERETHFRCFQLETNPSVSANIHLLSALYRYGFDNDHPSVNKIVSFLKGCKIDDQFWVDKWHSSTYYTTGHAIIAATGYNDELVADAVDWLIATQNGNGSWGNHVPTAEETAYALQALVTWRRQGYELPQHVFERGYTWLAEHVDRPYPPLWIGKCLYSPVMVIRSAILSALIMVEELL